MQVSEQTSEYVNLRCYSYLHLTLSIILYISAALLDNRDRAHVLNFHVLCSDNGH